MATEDSDELLEVDDDDDDDDDEDDDDDFLVFSTFSTDLLSFEAGSAVTEDEEEDDDEEEEEEEELELDVELLEHDDVLRLKTTSSVSVASHSLTSTCTTFNDSANNWSFMTVRGDSCVMRHIGTAVTLSSRMLTVDSWAESPVKYDSRRDGVGSVGRYSSPLVTVDDVAVSTEASTGADLGRADEFVNLDRRIEPATAAGCARRRLPAASTPDTEIHM